MACTVTPKVFLAFLTLVFWAAAGGLIFVGSWVFKEFDHFEELSDAIHTLVPAAVLIGAGIFFFILGLIGCIGACKEQKCLLGLYFTLLLVILLGLIVAAVLGYVYRNKIETGVRQNLKKGFDDYGKNGSSVITNEIDFMQENLKCCGMDNYTDWLNTDWHSKHPDMSYPKSCCEFKNCTTPYPEGCYQLLKTQFLGHLAVIGGVAASVAVIQLIGMACACILICRKRTDTPYIGLTSPEHLRV